MPTCKNCGKDFPNRVVLDGKVVTMYTRNYCVDIT
jgi:hypothetical protein